MGMAWSLGMGLGEGLGDGVVIFEWVEECLANIGILRS